MRLASFAGALAIGWTAAPAFAQSIIVADSGDSAGVMATALMALIAILPGLALFYGRGRAGPTGFALFGGLAVTSLLFAAVGYTLAFGEGSPYLGGIGNAMLGNLADLVDGATISEPVYVVFEMVAALFAVGIVCASLGEKARPSWLIPFSAVWLIIAYVPVARWVWPGWLGDLGTIDFAGGLPIQVTAGTAALVVALLLRSPVPGDVQHDSRFAAAGAGMLWVGFLAFIGAAALGGSSDAATAILNAHLAASAAIVTGLVFERLLTGATSVYGVANSAVVGLAAASSGAGVVGAGGAMALGIFGAIAAVIAGMLVRWLKLGSAASAFTLHGAPAIAGTLAFPLFILPIFGGPGYDEGNGIIAQFAAQAIAVLAVVLWTAIATVLAALTVSVVAPMRLQRGD